MDGSIGPTPRRRPPEGGYARGEETRERIIEAAFGVFADEGYVGASTRRIAAEAGVNPPALQYYFHSKEGLNRACGQSIVDRVMVQIGPTLDRGRAALAGNSRDAVVDALCDLIEGVADMALMRTASENWSRFMNRCQADDGGPAYDLVQQEIAAPLKGLTTQLVARALGASPEDGETKLRAMLILSQMASFHTHRDHTLTALGWADFTSERLATVRRVLRDHVRRLTAPV